MRVVLLTQVFPRAADDPLGAFLLHLAQAFGERATVHVVAPHALGLAHAEIIGGIDVTRFRYAPARWETLAYTGVMHERVARGLSGKLLFGAFNLAFLLAAFNAVRKHHADIIHAHWWLPGGLVGAVVSKLTGVPLVITTHGTDVEQLRRARWAMPLARFAFSQARTITCGSTYLREQLLALKVAVPERVQVIPMPVAEEFVNRNSTEDKGQRAKDEGHTSQATRHASQAPIANRRSRITSDEVRILTVVRLTAQKGVDTVIDAVAELRRRGMEVRLRVVGDGEERGRLGEQARRLGIGDWVEFVGMRPQVELPHYYGECDVFVLASVREGMGLVLAEALLCGAPVIATHSGGVTDIVRDGETGLLFPERDARALANAIERLARDPALAAQFAENGRQWVAGRYLAEKVAGEFLGVYEADL